MKNDKPVARELCLLPQTGVIGNFVPRKQSARGLG